METINNAVNAAAEAIWPSTNEQTGNTTTGNNASSNTTTTQTQTGSAPRTDAYDSATTSGSTSHLDNSEEPLSGVLGNTKRGEPYDAGNKAEQDAALEANRTSSSFSGGNDAYTSGDSAAYASSGTNTNSSTYNNQNPAGTSEAAGAAGLNNSRVPNTYVDDGSARQTNLEGSRDSYNPSGGATSSNASIASGRVAGGGSVGTPGSAAAGPPAGNATSEIHTSSQGEGTGEKYIRSTGLKADGGDFDAAREGAGREADRLLEEKGISVSKPSASHDVPSETKPTSSSTAAAATTSTSPSTGSSFDEPKDKKSLGDKIKEKLHHK